MSAWITWAKIKTAIATGARGLLVGQHEDGSDFPAAARVDPATGALRTKTMLAGVGGAAAEAASGVPARFPVSITRIYDAGPPVLSVTSTPLRPGVRVVWVGGAAESVAVSGAENDWTVTITTNNGVSTLASVVAALAASPVPTGANGQILAASIVALAGDAGVFPMGFSGGTDVLWANGTIAAALGFEMSDDGNYVPRTGDRRLATIYSSPSDVALTAGVATYLTPWLNTETYDVLAAFVVNPGGTNPITNLYAYYAPNPDGGGLFGCSAPVNGSTPTIPPGSSYLTMAKPISATNWDATQEARVRFRGLRYAATSTAGTTARIVVLGRKVR